MLLGRFLPMVFVLGLAGSLARQKPVPESTGTLPTHQPLFVGMLVGVTVIVVALTYLPALALGPLAEGIHDMIEGHAPMSVSTDSRRRSAPAEPPVPSGAAPRVRRAARPQAAAGGPPRTRCASSNPRTLWRNPVMFIVEVGSVFTTVLAIAHPTVVRLADHRSGCG